MIEQINSERSQAYMNEALNNHSSVENTNNIVKPVDNFTDPELTETLNTCKYTAITPDTKGRLQKMILVQSENQS